MASQMMIQDFARTQVRCMMNREKPVFHDTAIALMVAKAHSPAHAQALEQAYAELKDHAQAVRQMVEIRFVEAKPAGRMLAC